MASGCRREVRRVDGHPGFLAAAVAGQFHGLPVARHLRSDGQSVELFKHVQSGAFYLSQGLEDNVWKVPPADWLIL